jgi:hypothetical protein
MHVVHPVQVAQQLHRIELVDFVDDGDVELRVPLATLV